LLVHYQDLVALDAASGKELWRAELSARHASPIAVRIGKEDVLISPSGNLVRATDGKVLLSENGLQLSECSPILGDGVVFAQGGKFSAYRLPEAVTENPSLELLWQTSSARGRRTPSPVYHDGLLYGATTEGIFDVTDAATGQTVYRKRLDLDKNIYASVTLAGDLIFVSSTQGSTLILKTGRKYEEVARCELEPFGSCPVFVGKRMYVRAQKHLYCVGQ
jgi:outer membrane protein assembly factor BamB